MSLTGKVALVTGSTSGIGKSISEHLSRQGCSIIATGSRSEEAAAHTIDHIRQSSSAVVHYIKCDLNEKTEIDELYNKIVEIYPDGIDILVNNADWGRIINMSSIAGTVAIPNSPEYVTSKHGLVGLTKAVALETAEQGITCNAVMAGMTDTPMLHGLVKKGEEKLGFTHEQGMDILLSMIPTRKISTTTQIAEYVLFLCSPGANNMTGTAVPIDGGSTAK